MIIFALGILLVIVPLSLSLITAVLQNCSHTGAYERRRKKAKTLLNATSPTGKSELVQENGSNI